MYKHRERSRRTRRWLIGLAVLAAVCLAWSLVEARLVFVDESVVTSPDLPSELDGTRIAFACDIHAGSLLGKRHMQSTLDKIAALDTDLIVIGGDFGGGGRQGYEWFYPAAARLDAPLGVYAVLGNHEGGGGRAGVRRELEAAGIELLENDNVRLARGGLGMRLAGVDDALTGSPDAVAAADDISRNEFAVLVSHSPDALPEGLADAEGAFDLALSGHTHGGQITFFGLWAPVLASEYGQRFSGGWETVEGTPVLVSRGSGVIILPMRFFAPAQIHLITLRRGEASVTP